MKRHPDAPCTFDYENDKANKDRVFKCSEI